MADFFLDTSAIGNEYQAYTDTPTTWGVPQDGNGKAGPGHSAAVAIATIDVAGCTASGTGTIGVFGINVSTTLNASGAALATAIVSAINASSTAVSATYSAALLPLNRLVFARVNPGLNTQVQIMLRIAGTDWVSFSPTQANISPAATISNFAGGANGPFAYYWNTSVIGTVFGRTQRTYGLFVAKSPGVTEPTINDPIWVRTRRSGSDLSITHSTSSTNNINTPGDRTFFFDNGTKWTGDNGRFKVTFNSSGGFHTYGCGTGFSLRLIALAKYGHEFVFVSTSGNQYMDLNINSAITVHEENCLFTELLSGGTLAQMSMFGNQQNMNCLMKSCKTAHVGARGVFAGQLQSFNSRYLFVDTEFTYTGVGTNLTSIMSLGNSPANFNEVEFRACKWSIDNDPSYKLINPVSNLGSLNSGSLWRVVFDDACVGLGAGTFGPPRSTQIPVMSFMWDGIDDQGSFRYENGQYSIDYIASNAEPYLTAFNAFGTYWSHKVGLFSTGLTINTPFKIARYRVKYRDTSATRTVKLQLLTATAVPLTNAQIGILVKYTDSSNVVRQQISYESSALHINGTATALANGVGVQPGVPTGWFMNGNSTHESKVLQITTLFPIKTDSEVSVSLMMLAPPTTSTTIYVNPEVEIV